MAAANTYVPIATTNLSSAATDYTFTLALFYYCDC